MLLFALAPDFAPFLLSIYSFIAGCTPASPQECSPAPVTSGVEGEWGSSPGKAGAKILLSAAAAARFPAPNGLIWGALHGGTEETHLLITWRDLWHMSLQRLKLSNQNLLPPWQTKS